MYKCQARQHIDIEIKAITDNIVINQLNAIRTKNTFGRINGNNKFTKSLQAWKDSLNMNLIAREVNYYVVLTKLNNIQKLNI